MTAVEFIVDELNKEMGLISFVTGTEESYKSAIFSIIERAKEMEQEQMIDWYATGQADTVNMYEQHLKKPSNTKEK